MSEKCYHFQKFFNDFNLQIRCPAHGVQGVGGSNPLIPTKISKKFGPLANHASGPFFGIQGVGATHAVGLPWHVPLYLPAPSDFSLFCPSIEPIGPAILLILLNKFTIY